MKRISKGVFQPALYNPNFLIHAFNIISIVVVLAYKRPNHEDGVKITMRLPLCTS